MFVPVEVIYFLSIAVCAYSSYKLGYKQAVPEAVDLTLYNLEASGIIEIDDDGNVKKAK